MTSIIFNKVSLIFYSICAVYFLLISLFFTSMLLDLIVIIGSVGGAMYGMIKAGPSSDDIEREIDDLLN